jgi:hypothetical protein
MSFSFEELAVTRPAQWYWLLIKSRGLVSNEPVDTEEFPSDPRRNIIVAGRISGMPNEFVSESLI